MQFYSLIAFAHTSSVFFTKFNFLFARNTPLSSTMSLAKITKMSVIMCISRGLQCSRVVRKNVCTLYILFGMYIGVNIHAHYEIIILLAIMTKRLDQAKNTTISINRVKLTLLHNIFLCLFKLTRVFFFSKLTCLPNLRHN